MPPSPGPMLRMEPDFPSSMPRETSGDSWARTWLWWAWNRWLVKQRRFLFRDAWTASCKLNFWTPAAFIPADRWDSRGAGVCWGHLSVCHALHLRQVRRSPGDGLPQLGHRWHHASVWSHHVSACPQGGGLLCLLQQVGWTEATLLL